MKTYCAISWYSEDVCEDEPCKSTNRKNLQNISIRVNPIVKLRDLANPKELQPRGAISNTCFEGYNDKRRYGFNSIAVGEKHIMQVLNNTVVIYTKEGEQTSTFPASLISEGLSLFPSCHYDPFAKKFLIYDTVYEGDYSENMTTFTIAQSKSEDPTMGYNVFKFKVDYDLGIASNMGSWHNGLYIAFTSFIWKPTDPKTDEGFSSIVSRMCVINRESLTTSTAKALRFEHTWTRNNWRLEDVYFNKYSPDMRMTENTRQRGTFFSFPLTYDPDNLSATSKNDMDAFVIKLCWSSMKGAARRLRFKPNNFEFLYLAQSQQKGTDDTFEYGNGEQAELSAPYVSTCGNGAYWLRVDNTYSGKPYATLMQLTVTNRCVNIIQQCNTRYGSQDNEGRMFGRPLVNIFGDVALFYFKSSSDTYVDTMLTYRFDEDEQGLLTPEQDIVKSTGTIKDASLRKSMSVSLDSDCRSFIVCTEYFTTSGYRTKICRIKL